MYHNILVPLDGSELAECVLPHVQSIAKGCAVPDVTLVRAVEPFRNISTGEYIFPEADIKRIDAESKAAAKKYLEQVVSQLKKQGLNAKAEILTGRAADTIAPYANKIGADLIVIATHGRSGVSKWVWGSVADKLLRSACVPVLMVRAPGCVVGV
ncbi:MAG: universal stress protein [Dehalococcoidales bacterium]|nr:universal stress protein [Dehalococcoidales bacterium]